MTEQVIYAKRKWLRKHSSEGPHSFFEGRATRRQLKIENGKIVDWPMMSGEFTIGDCARMLTFYVEGDASDLKLLRTLSEELGALADALEEAAPLHAADVAAQAAFQAAKKRGEV